MSKKYKCLFIKQPFADEFAKKRMTVHIMPRPIAYRGEIVICAEDGSGEQYGMYDGAWLAKAEIVDCKPVAELTREQIAQSDMIGNRKKAYALILGNIRRLVEFPCHGHGFVTMELNEDDMVEYPTHVILDDKGYRMIMAGVWKGAN